MGKEFLSRKQKSIRLDLTLEGTKNGMTYYEIQDRFEKSKNHFYSDFRGECSVSNVKRVIEQLPLKKYKITQIFETRPNGYKDIVEKHDLEIISNDKDIGLIGVQIKSSSKSVDDFCLHFHEDIDIAKKILIQKKIIVLNGSGVDSIIQRNFIDQFQQIYNFCKTQSNI